MPDKASQESKINKVKIYTIAVLIFLFVNFALETAITMLENKVHQWLYPIFPFTSIGLLIITILIANSYIRRREYRPKQKLWWRFLKPVILILIFFGLTMGAWLSVSQADADRATVEAEKASQSIQNLQVPTKAEINAKP